MDFKDINHRLGTCVIWFNKNSLNEIVETTAATEEATVLIANSDEIMALNSKYNQPELKDEIDQMLSNHSDSLQSGNIQEMTFMKQQCFVLMKDHVNTGWKSVNIVPIKSIYTEALNTLYLGMYLAIATILILLVFGFFMIRSISRPLTSITSVLDSIGNGKRKQRIEIVDKNEFGIISESINTMLDNVESMNQRIFTMQSELYEKELMQKESEMLALQSQINPHFLYNTLECIRSIATIHKIKEISVITTSMAKIFRYSIKGGLMSTFEKELECVSDYYKIIAIRYNGRLKMNFTVDQGLFPYSILKMSLQPIIENSVYHGLEATEGEVAVDLKGWIEGDYAIVSIEDNGIGIEPEKVKELNDVFGKPLRESIADVSMSRSSIGLANINARIKLHYGEECGLNIQSTSNVNTTVILKIKLKKE
jgi:two-component system sensor histidine kinase YesM